MHLTNEQRIALISAMGARNIEEFLVDIEEFLVDARPDEIHVTLTLDSEPLDGRHPIESRQGRRMPLEEFADLFVGPEIQNAKIDGGQWDFWDRIKRTRLEMREEKETLHAAIMLLRSVAWYLWVWRRPLALRAPDLTAEKVLDRIESDLESSIFARELL